MNTYTKIKQRQKNTLNNLKDKDLFFSFSIYNFWKRFFIFRTKFYNILIQTKSKLIIVNQSIHIWF